QRLARRGAKGGRVEAIVLQPARRQLLRVRGLAWAAERAGGAEAGIVDQDDQDIGRALGRTQLLDGREFGVRILRVIGDQSGSLRRRHGQMGTMLLILAAHGILSLRGYDDEIFWFVSSKCRGFFSMPIMRTNPWR